MVSCLLYYVQAVIPVQLFINCHAMPWCIELIVAWTFMTHDCLCVMTFCTCDVEIGYCSMCFSDCLYVAESSSLQYGYMCISWKQDTYYVTYICVHPIVRFSAFLCMGHIFVKHASLLLSWMCCLLLMCTKRRSYFGKSYAFWLQLLRRYIYIPNKQLYEHK